MTNAEQIEAINYWQACGHAHPLTCGNDSGHENLIPIEESDSVILKCPTCDYVQRWVPECCLRLKRIDDELRARP